MTQRTPCPEPERLHPDPSVALVGYRFPAESPGPQIYHDVALMLGEQGPCPRGLWCTDRHEAIRRGARIECGLCGAVLRYWTCDCGDATFRERACKHVSAAIGLWAHERAGTAGERSEDPS